VFTLIERFSPLASRYDVLLCDVWGVVHNGIAAFPEAGDALARFRAGGGTVIFITNARYPADAVQRFLDRLGVRGDSYDAITSSGAVTRGLVEARLAERVFHLGPPRDRPIFAGLDVTFAPVETADYVVCTGLFDDTVETPESYPEMLALMRRRSLLVVCANPDVVVERGDTLVYCAGALADAYVALGGEALYCGKPHAPIYEAALNQAVAFRGDKMPPLPEFWRSAIRSAPILQARPPSAWISCSSFPAYTPINSSCAKRRIQSKCWRLPTPCPSRSFVDYYGDSSGWFSRLIACRKERCSLPAFPGLFGLEYFKLYFRNSASAAFAIERWPARTAIVSSSRLLLAVTGA
jgi:HAD superfamily hydrolase (TIGR01459 family)